LSRRFIPGEQNKEHGCAMDVSIFHPDENVISIFFELNFVSYATLCIFFTYFCALLIAGKHFPDAPSLWDHYKL
jgi:hypothetical protein